MPLKSFAFQYHSEEHCPERLFHCLQFLVLHEEQGDNQGSLGHRLVGSEHTTNSIVGHSSQQGRFAHSITSNKTIMVSIMKSTPSSTQSHLHTVRLHSGEGTRHWLSYQWIWYQCSYCDLQKWVPSLSRTCWTSASFSNDDHVGRLVVLPFDLNALRGQRWGYFPINIFIFGIF